jgi:hypothetical protein
MWGRGCGVGTMELHRYVGKMAWCGCTYLFWKVDWTPTAYWTASSLAESNSDGDFPVGTSEGSRLYGPSLEYRRYGDSSWRKVVAACSREGRAALRWTEAALNSYCNIEAPMVSSSVSLRHLAVTCMLKTKRRRANVVQYLRVVIKQGIIGARRTQFWRGYRPVARQTTTTWSWS